MECLPSKQRPKSILWGKKGVDSGSGLAWRTFRLELHLFPAPTGGRHPTLGTTPSQRRQDGGRIAMGEVSVGPQLHAVNVPEAFGTREHISRV